MDYERLLLSKVAQTQKIETLLLEGYGEEHFYDLDSKKIFTFLVEHFKRYKKAPSFSTVVQAFPKHNFEIIDEPVDFLKDKFRSELKWRFATDIARDLAQELQKGAEYCSNIDELFLERSRELTQLIPSTSVSRLSDLDQRLEDYLTPLDGTQGIKMGIPAFDNITFGIQPHEYVSIIGPSGLGKSTLAQYLLLNAYLQNKTPMYVSLEMESSALLRKWDAMLTPEVAYDNLKAHDLDAQHKKALEKTISKVKNQEADLIILDDVRNCSVDRIYAEMVRWQPDIVAIDYISLMGGFANNNAPNWEKTMYITQQLKQTTRSLKIPIIGVAQTGRSSFQDGAQLDNVSGSISIVQDSDMVIGLHQDKQMRDDKLMQLRMLKNRDGRLENTDMYWDMENMDFAPWNLTRHQALAH